MTTSNTQFSRHDELIDHLLALPPSVRAEHLAHLDRDAADDAKAVRAWLAAIEQSDGYLEKDATDLADIRIAGPWRALRRIGQGGMGEVWLGERADGAFQKQVAIKFILTDNARLRASLESERSLLASLEHPRIARLLDGGVTGDGKPFLVTEYIDGEQIDVWCREHDADIQQRLNLFRQVCDAVAYAHANLIVHRDIKPANVLVDKDGRAHLLDFGIARLLDNGTQAQQTAEQALTPNFAAPEQLIDSVFTMRTDVYALGGLLYLLIGGRPPLETQGLTLGSLIKRVSEEIPQAPSRLAHKAIFQSLANDLDAIALKALAKSPADRYASVDALLSDLDSACAQRPVAAHRNNTSVYKFRLFLRRNKLASVLVALVIVAIAIGVIGVVWQARRATAAAQRTEEEAMTATAASEFLVDIFNSASPEQTLGKIPDALQILETGAKRVDTELVTRPELQVRLYDALATIYCRLGQSDLCKKNYQKGLDVVNRDDLQYTSIGARLIINFSGNFSYQGEQNAELLKLLDGIVLQQRALPPERRTLLPQALIAQASLIHESSVAPNIELLRQAVNEAKELGQLGDSDRAVASLLLALSLNDDGSTQEAIAYMREAIRINEGLYGPMDSKITTAKRSLAKWLAQTGGNLKEAEQMLRGIEAQQRQVLGDSHPQYVKTLCALTVVLARAEKFADADRYSQQALDIARSFPDSKKSSVLYLALAARAFLAGREGDFQTAREFQNQVVAEFGDDSDSAARMDAETAECTYAVDTGDYGYAENCLRREIADAEKIKWNGSPAMPALARTLRLQGHSEKAVELAANALEVSTRRQGAFANATLDIRYTLAQAQRDMGLLDDARRNAEQVGDGYAQTLPAAHSSNTAIRYFIAQLDSLQGTCTRASLVDLDTMWGLRKQSKETPMLQWQIAEAGLMVGLCKRQMKMPDPAENDKLIAQSAKVLRDNPLTDAYFKKLAIETLLKQ